MLSVSNLSVQFGKRILFDEVNATFTQGNCYGIIGANGAGKSTFLKIIAGQIDPTSGHVHLEPGKRMSILEQNHNASDEFTVLETVVKGNKPLYKIKKEIDELYADYTDENADRIGELQVQFEEMNGWNADSDAAASAFKSWYKRGTALHVNVRSGFQIKGTCATGSGFVRFPGCFDYG